jgi:tRNA(Leu) C34 or U34 (ribose-2'-O)-methylase TrmL
MYLVISLSTPSHALRDGRSALLFQPHIRPAVGYVYRQRIGKLDALQFLVPAEYHTHRKAWNDSGILQEHLFRLMVALRSFFFILG